MKKSLFVLIPTIFLVTGCKSTQEKCTNHVDLDPADHKCDVCGKVLSQCADNDGDYFCDICHKLVGNPEDNGAECADDDEVCKAEAGSDKAKADPAYPFYMKVYKDPSKNDTKKISAKITTEIAEQKNFTFTNQSPEHIEFDPAKTTNNSVTLVAKKATGLNKFATVHAINDYSSGLTTDYSINVIDFDNDTMKLWQYDSSDRKQFGYDSKEAKQGIQEGTANLGGLNWEFKRSAVNSLNTGNGGLVFGKNEAPENVTLVNRNIRPIKKIVIEHGSARAQGQVEVKIGETVVKTVKAPKPYYSRLTKSEINCDNLSGDITLSLTTPAFDVTRIEDPDYMRPGAYYLKSIWIEYGEEMLTGINIPEESSQQIVFSSWDQFNTDGLIVNRVSENGETPIDIDALEVITPDFEVNPDASKEVVVKYKDFQTSYTIYKADKIELNPDLSTPVRSDYLEYDNFDSTAISVLGISTVSGLKQDFSAINGLIKWCSASSFNEEKGTASKQYLIAGDESVIGFVDKHPELGHVSIAIKPVHEVEAIEIGEGTSPTTVKYLEGSSFSTAGLKVYGFDANKEIVPVNITSQLKWYNPATYPAEGESEPSTTLSVGQTSVIGVYKDKLTVTVSGLTVVGFDHFEVVDGTPDTKDYITGSEFKSGGLEILAYGSNSEFEPIKLTGSKFTWYDGPSYKAEPQVKTKKLAEGTTFVVGEYSANKSLTVEISGLTVTSYKKLTAEIPEGVQIKTTYLIGETIDPTGLVVKATTGGDNPIEATVTGDKSLKFYTDDSIAAGKPSNKVTEATTGFVASYAELNSDKIQIALANLVKVEVDSTELKKSRYAEMSQFDPSGLKILGYFDSIESDPVDITGRLSITWYDGPTYNKEGSSSSWEKTLNVGTTEVIGVVSNYDINTLSVSVEVLPFTRIDATEQTLKKINYAEGEKFSTDGINVYGYTEDETLEAVKIPNAKCKFYDSTLAPETTYRDTLREGTEAVQVEYTSKGKDSKTEQLISTISGIHVYKIFAIEVRGEAEILDYSTGEKFNPKGLSVIALYGVQGTENVFEKDITNNVTWYDGIGFESEATNRSELLSEGSTSVFASYVDFSKTEFKTNLVTINSVKTAFIDITKVKSIDTIKEGGKFLIVSEPNDVYLNGSLSGNDMKLAKGAVAFDFNEAETYNVSKAYEVQMATVEFSDGFFTIKCGSTYLGLTDSGNISWAQSPKQKKLTIEMDESGNLTIKCEHKDYIKYYGFVSGIFNFVSEETSNIQFYKVA